MYCVVARRSLRFGGYSFEQDLFPTTRVGGRNYTGPGATRGSKMDGQTDAPSARLCKT
jgi:hypothetical protein